MATWGIVLAGGDGTRLAELARHKYGYARPKQFCDFDGRGTLIERTIRTMLPVVPESRIVVSTSRPHRAEAFHALRSHPAITQTEQPRNRDTTPGLLGALLHVLARDRHAIVLVTPSDHDVRDPALMRAAMARAIDLAVQDPGRIALVAAEPDGPEDGYGWVVPAVDGTLDRVACFREKPPAEEVAALFRQGALVNTLVFAARARQLAAEFARHTPGWWRTLTWAARDTARLDAAYDVLPASNFSRDVLERIPHRLRIVPLRAAGWSDIGTPDRLMRSIRATRRPTGPDGALPRPLQRRSSLPDLH